MISTPLKATPAGKPRPTHAAGTVALGDWTCSRENSCDSIG